jgi:Alr-MurF fusion protein
MPSYRLSDISRILKGNLHGRGEAVISHLVYDSRRIQHPESSLFFALQTGHEDGHRFVADAYKKGVRAFVVQQPLELEDATLIVVDNTLSALQALATHHRQQFQIPVIGITGSNGKTIVKEWLHHLLEQDYQIIRSPKSFNSQIGVAVSVWQVEPQHTLAIFEAGISMPDEMMKLQEMIQPTIGVLTNIGEAHSEGFASIDEKLREKLKLFTKADVVIGPAELLATVKAKTFTWSASVEASLEILSVTHSKEVTTIHALYKEAKQTLEIPFSDEASVQNAITCWCVLLHLGLKQEQIQERFRSLHPVDMRLQLNHGINHCLVINDSYSADTTSLKIALDFLVQQSAGLSRTVILSDFYESGKDEKSLYEEITRLVNHYGIQKLIAVGSTISEELQHRIEPTVLLQTYPSTEVFLQRFRSSDYYNEIILIKGARKAGFERIASLFEQKLHGTVLQINLSALTHNLKQYQQALKPTTKIMAMVKAFSYGSGGVEIASVMQFNNVAYLGVAYADEGVELVKAGITLPIMVMNAESSSFATIIEHSLQPVIYSVGLLHSFESYIKQQGLTAYPVHLEIETGMNRLGFAAEEIAYVANHFSVNPYLHVQSVFSHLAASEEAANDVFTKQQVRQFEEAVNCIQEHLAYPFLKHISNSAAIVRHPHLQMDMVRLGIGLYGVEPDGEDRLDLQAVATLRSTVAQIKEVKSGESVSYNRRGVVQRDSRVATVRIGYADGYSRRFGNGVGKMLIRGKLAPVVGTVCMDMTMVDVTGIPDVREGDDVIIFGAELPVQEVAGLIQTIPYEIMTSVSQRVKRVYYYE